MDSTLTRIADLETALALLRRDWRRLAPRIRTLEHDVTISGCRLNLRLHYPALRDSKATVGELVEIISLYMPNFCLPRNELDAVHAKKDKLDPFEIHTELTRLNQRALDLFRRVQVATGRNGEAGELLLYLLTEWVLGAPQIIAKMGLKTSRNVPVHGADGIHARFDTVSSRLYLYFGEAKLHARITDAISSAIDSITKATAHSKTKHELELVQRYIDFSGLDESAKEALVTYLDPYSGDEASNRRIDVMTCLIGFDFSGYSQLEADDDDPDQTFCDLARAELERRGGAFAQALIDAELDKQAVELFLLPLPSVGKLRDLFQEHIGWLPE